jgi:hypothetical protein
MLARCCEEVLVIVNKSSPIVQPGNLPTQLLVWLEFQIKSYRVDSMWLDQLCISKDDLNDWSKLDFILKKFHDAMFFYNIKIMTSRINPSKFRLTHHNYDFFMGPTEFNNFAF